MTSTRFEIVNGQLKLKAGISLNHEAESSTTVRIIATDGGGPPLSVQSDFVITITDVNEVPTSITLGNNSVNENSPAAVIGSVTVSDPDDPAVAFGQHTLAVLENYGAGFVISTRFEIVSGQLRLKAGQQLNHETDDPVTVRIRATDGGNLVLNQDFQITVNDVNETPTDIQLSNTSVNENSPGATVGNVTILDPDDPALAIGQHTVVVQEDYGAGFVTSTRFEIVGGQLRLKAGQQLDHETEDQVTVRIIATDGGGLSRTENFTITVTDVNKAPTAINLSNASVNENSVAAIVGNITVVDPDDDAEPFGTHTFQVQKIIVRDFTPARDSRSSMDSSS